MVISSGVHLRMWVLMCSVQVQDLGFFHILTFHLDQKLLFLICPSILNNKNLDQVPYLDQNHLLNLYSMNIFHLLLAKIDSHIFNFSKTIINLKITPGPGTFKPFGSLILPDIFILCLDFNKFPS